MGIFAAASWIHRTGVIPSSAAWNGDSRHVSHVRCSPFVLIWQELAGIVIWFLSSHSQPMCRSFWPWDFDGPKTIHGSGRIPLDAAWNGDSKHVSSVRCSPFVPIRQGLARIRTSTQLAFSSLIDILLEPKRSMLEISKSKPTLWLGTIFLPDLARCNNSKTKV